VSRFFVKYARWISLAGVLLTLASGFFVVKLYANLKPDIEELLPTTSRSVVDLKQVTSRLRSIDNLAILVFSKNGEAAGRFQADLAHKLESLPAQVSAGVEYKISDELRFFDRRKALFISIADLKDIRDFIRKRIAYEKFIANPVNLVIDRKPLEPEYDFQALEKKYGSRSEEFSHFPGGVYATPDGTKRLILVDVPDQSITTAHRLKEQVLKAVQKVGPAHYAPDLSVRYSGNVQDIIEEQAALLEDLTLSTVLVTILVSLVLYLYFRAFVATLALIANLVVGTTITFGIAYFAVGYLNANSAFLGSIVMGNGINFGIMVLARYLEERRGHERDHDEALGIALKETWLPTLTAAVAAAVSYGSLMLTSFRGFSQFGVIGLIGMLVCWVSAYTFFPAFLTVLSQKFSVVGSEQRVESRSLWAAALKFLLTHLSKPVAIAGILLTVFAVHEVAHLDRSIIESDLTKLRDKRSMTEGSGYLTRYIDEILKRYSSPIAVLAQDEPQSKQIADRLKQLKADDPHSMIASVMRVQDFVPPDQKEKIEVLRQIEQALPPQILWRLSDAEKKRVKEFVSPETLKPFTMLDLPTKLLDRFREKDGRVGNLVLVEPPLTDEIHQGDSLLHFVKGIREAVDSVAEGVPVAGRLPVSADMLAAILKEGPMATLFSGLAVAILTVLLFRNLQISAMVLASLVLGVLWLMAILVWTHLKINFLNFIAFPITFGIGVDYAVNVFQRYREERRRSEQSWNERGGRMDRAHAMIRAVYHTGGAVVLASLTTTIGWGSLLIAGNQAFVSFGKVAVIGEVACVTAAVLVIPSVFASHWRKNRP